MSKQSEQIQFAQWILERNLGWIAAAEVKAGFIVAIDSAMLGALATAFSGVEAYERTAWANVITCIAGAFLVIGVICTAMAVLPRLSGPKSSNIFFGGICKKTALDFESEFIACHPEDLLKDCLAQIHRNGEIAIHKFSWVKSGMLWSFAAILPWVAALAMLVKD